MKISILGAGSIGGYIGSRFIEKHDVTFIGRQRFINDTNDHGIRYKAPDNQDQQFTADQFIATESTDSLKDADIIFVCVKSKDTESAAQLIKENLDDSTENNSPIIISLQNGIYNAETIANMTGKTVIQGMVPFNVAWLDEMTFHQTTNGNLVFEDHADTTNTLKKIFEEIQFPAIFENDIRAIMWSKLVINMNNSLNALAGRPLKECLSNRNYRKALAAMMNECLAILKKAGIPPQPINGKPVTIIPKVLALPNFLFKIIAGAMLKIDPEARSSMFDDLELNREPEVDFINGEIIRLAKQYNMPAPLNERAIKLIEAAYQNKQGSPNIPFNQL